MEFEATTQSLTVRIWNTADEDVVIEDSFGFGAADLLQAQTSGVVRSSGPPYEFPYGLDAAYSYDGRTIASHASPFEDGFVQNRILVSRFSDPRPLRLIKDRRYEKTLTLRELTGGVQQYVGEAMNAPYLKFRLQLYVFENDSRRVVLEQETSWLRRNISWPNGTTVTTNRW